MSPLRRLWGWLRGSLDEPVPPRLGSGAQANEPAVLRSQDETWLAKLVAAVAEGERHADIAGEEFWQHIEALWAEGHEKLAVEWIEKFIGAREAPPGTATQLRARLVELLERRGDLAGGLAHLEILTQSKEHATRAHYLLAEHFRRRGHVGSAMRHYEAVLARDMSYSNARVRLERLRRERGGAEGVGSQAATIAGAEALGHLSGARYHLLRELGRGATAVVYLARDTQLDREVAVKLLHPHLAAATQRDACARFFAEARLAASLRHPNIIAILDIDERARRLVMELAAGGTLRESLENDGAYPPVRAFERHVQLLSALSTAHARGIVHRDVKPANLMFRRHQEAPGVEIVLTDFGVAHLPEDAGRHTRDETAAEARVRGDAVGTLGYMPPEQRRGLDVTGRADVYAAAVVLFEMLTGRHPQSRETILSGQRGPSDFTLESEEVSSIPSAVRIQVQEHLHWLSAPSQDDRPDADVALARARELRDRLVAGSPSSAA